MAYDTIAPGTPPLLFVVWEDAHALERRSSIEEAHADNLDCMMFSVGWLIKETKHKIILYSNLVTWSSAPYKIDEVDTKWAIPKKWIRVRHEIRLPKKALKYE